MAEQLNTVQFNHDKTALFRELLNQGALDFPTHETGFLSASEISNAELSKATGMGMAWYRDNAHVANALLTYGDGEHTSPAIRDEYISKATGVGRVFLETLHRNESMIEQVIANPQDAPRLPVRFDAKTLENDTENRNQTDSTAYAIWLPAKLMSANKLPAHIDDLKIMEQTVRYLEAIRYRETPDDGQWEEDSQVHASSIGVTVGSLEEVRLAFDKHHYETDIDFGVLIGRGEEALAKILPAETPASADYPGRECDTSSIFLINPMNVLNKDQSRLAVDRLRRCNVRANGAIRYPGDSYWAPGFEELFSIEQRTKLTEGSTDERNEKLSALALKNASEAQWSLFDPLFAQYSLENGEIELGKWHINRSLGQLAATEAGLKFPELRHFDPKTGLWILNPHMPLMWTQGNALQMLNAYEKLG